MNPIISKNIASNYNNLINISLDFLLQNIKVIYYEITTKCYLSIHSLIIIILDLQKFKCIKDFNIEQDLNKLVLLFNTSRSCNIKHYIDIFKGPELQNYKHKKIIYVYLHLRRHL